MWSEVCSVAVEEIRTAILVTFTCSIFVFGLCILLFPYNSEANIVLNWIILQNEYFYI